MFIGILSWGSAPFDRQHHRCCSQPVSTILPTLRSQNFIGELQFSTNEFGTTRSDASSVKYATRSMPQSLIPGKDLASFGMSKPVMQSKILSSMWSRGFSFFFSQHIIMPSKQSTSTIFRQVRLQCSAAPTRMSLSLFQHDIVVPPSVYSYVAELLTSATPYPSFNFPYRLKRCPVAGHI